MDEAKFQIDALTKKINGFSKNQETVSIERSTNLLQLTKKNEFKASSYMGEINERQTELNQARVRLLEQEEVMRVKEVQAKQLTNERDFLHAELKKLDQAFKDLQKKMEDQTRLLTNVTGHKKNPAAGMQHAGEEALQKV